MAGNTGESITLADMRSSLYSAVVADALDALGYRNQSPRIQLCPYTSEGVLVGRCKTTHWEDIDHEDPRPYELELQAVDACHEDDVLIAAADGSNRSGIWGELLSTAAKNRGCVGAIVDGSIRDIAKLQVMGFAVFARGRSVYDSLHRQRVTAIDVPVEIAGVPFLPGELVIADQDGVVVVPREVEAEAIRNAWEKVHAENRTRDAILGGMGAVKAYDKFGVL